MNLRSRGLSLTMPQNRRQETKANCSKVRQYVVPGSPSDLNTGNRIEGATGCPRWCRPLRPLFHFLCSNLKANPVLYFEIPSIFQSCLAQSFGETVQMFFTVLVRRRYFPIMHAYSPTACGRAKCRLTEGRLVSSSDNHGSARASGDGRTDALYSPHSGMSSQFFTAASGTANRWKGRKRRRLAKCE